ncbi:hypothetical protein [Conexibacter sp. SYSU D00693]|uniref:hypothetical protein n=1 Tax=Conexibacter sp. SYSU D00693 TaxID=2812560 RepID=UPI00196BAE53|nr:hypothetical protein [Conexibacter sp. SYSU D00693]
MLVVAVMVGPGRYRPAIRRATRETTAPAELARELASAKGRGAGTDAERRAAKRLARELWAHGREARVETLWVRPQWAAPYAAVAVGGIAASVVSVDHARTALWIALASLVLLVLELAGAGVLRRLTRERATQLVVSPARAAGRRVTLLVTASTDAPRRGALTGVPGAVRVVAWSLLGVAVFCALRSQDVDDDWLGPAQLVPTIGLVVAFGALLDHAFAPPDPSPGAATGPAAALAVAAALDARPPRRLAVEVVLCGAGALGMAAHLQRLRRAGVSAEEVCVLHLGDCGSGPPRFWRREGLVVPLAAHPQLVALAQRLAAEETHLQAAPTASATTSPARVARARRWPAIRLGTRRQGGELDPAALQATVELAVGLVRRLDAELGAAEPEPARPASGPRRPKRLLARTRA